jgi:hypothetical protein
LAWAIACNVARREQARKDKNLEEMVRTEGYSSVYQYVEGSNRTMARKLYPTYGAIDADGQVVNPEHWQAPVSVGAPCAFPKPYYDLVGFCTGGCLAAYQMVAFPEGEMTFPDALSRQQDHIMTLTPDSNMETLSYKSTPVQGYVSSIGRSENPMIKIETAGGDHMTAGSIVVTTNHPMLLADGRMVQASTLHEGDLLLDMYAQPEAITSLSSFSEKGKVYNVFIDSKDLKENVIVAGGLLNGSAFFQNEGQKYLNRAVLRLSLPDGLINE